MLLQSAYHCQCHSVCVSQCHKGPSGSSTNGHQANTQQGMSNSLCWGCIKQKPLLSNWQGCKIKLLIKTGNLGARPVIDLKGSCRCLGPTNVRIEELYWHPHADQSGAGTNSATMRGVGNALHLPHEHQLLQHRSDSLGARLPRVQQTQQAGILVLALTQLSNKTHTKLLQPRQVGKRHKP